MSHSGCTTGAPRAAAQPGWPPQVAVVEAATVPFTVWHRLWGWCCGTTLPPVGQCMYYIAATLNVPVPSIRRPLCATVCFQQCSDSATALYQSLIISECGPELSQRRRANKADCCPQAAHDRLFPSGHDQWWSNPWRWWCHWLVGTTGSRQCCL